MLQNNPQTAPQVDLMAIDALFKRIAERGRKVRAQGQSKKVVDDKEQTAEFKKDSPLTGCNQNKAGQ